MCWDEHFFLGLRFTASFSGLPCYWWIWWEVTTSIYYLPLPIVNERFRNSPHKLQIPSPSFQIPFKKTPKIIKQQISPGSTFINERFFFEPRGETRREQIRAPCSTAPWADPNSSAAARGAEPPLEIPPVKRQRGKWDCENSTSKMKEYRSIRYIFNIKYYIYI